MTLLTRSAALLAAVLLTGSGTALAASSGGHCGQVDPSTGECQIWVTDPGSGGGNVPVGNGGSGGGQPCVSALGETVPCTSQYGSWSADYKCWLQPTSPQPPKSDPVWHGHTDGVIYDCTFPAGPGSVSGLQLWFAAPPGVDPAVLAQQAVAAMNLHAINIGITPEPGQNRMGYVGLPTYLWVEQPTPDTFGPITRSAGSGGITVTATAQVQQIRWAMGDGQSVTCDNPGTPYQDSYGSRPSPTCGYTYTQARDPYNVTATSHWVITWAGGGQTGTIPMDLTATTQIRVGEAQVLVQ